jgi:hypothetical protein
VQLENTLCIQMRLAKLFLVCMLIESTKKYPMISNIKIGIAVGAIIAATLTVTEPEVQSTQEVRIPDSIDQGSPPSLQMYKYIKAYADTFQYPGKLCIWSSIL